MTEYELNALIILSAETCGEVLEFWVSISFAVVVASFFIAKEVKFKIFRIIGILYVLSSLFMASIYIGSSLRAAHYFNLLFETGADVSHFDNAFSSSTILMASLLFFGGMAATLFYMHFCSTKVPGENEST